MIDRVEVDEKDLRLLVSALRNEADGKELSRDLVRELTRVAEPALRAAQGELMSMGSTSNVLPGLRSTVARRTKIKVRLGGRRPGVAILSDKIGMPRGFNNAPKRLNSARGWRHMVFGQDRWVTQRGKPGWFDTTISRFKPAAERAARKALDDVARRIDRRTKG